MKCQLVPLCSSPSSIPSPPLGTRYLQWWGALASLGLGGTIEAFFTFLPTSSLPLLGGLSLDKSLQ